MSDSESKSDEDVCTPSKIPNAAKNAVNNLLPEKSKIKYDKVYKDFMGWKIMKRTASFSEDVLLAYFEELSSKFKSTSLWTFFSMLKSTLFVRHQIDIANYSKLKAFLKRKSEGHKAKKSKTFSTEEIQKFLDDAPEKLYLFTKTCLIFGVMGACRRQELYNMLYTDVQVTDSTILVNIKNNKMKTYRSFTITGTYKDLVKRYIALRPTECPEPNFFLKYSSGKCFNQKVGINKFGALGKTIAEFLNLPSPEKYTGHCFRRTSATLNARGNIASVNGLGGRSSTTVTEGEIDETSQDKVDMSNNILNSIRNKHIININLHSNQEQGLNVSLQASGQLLISQCTIQNVNNYYYNK